MQQCVKMHMMTHVDYNLKIFYYDPVRYTDIHTGSWGLQVETFLKIRHEQMFIPTFLKYNHLLMIRHDITNTHTDSWGLHLKLPLQTRHKLYFYRVLGSNACKLFMSRHNITLFQPTQGLYTLLR